MIDRAVGEFGPGGDDLGKARYACGYNWRSGIGTIMLA